MMITTRVFTTGLATLVLSLTFSLSTNAQSGYEATLEKADAQHQDCLDNGEHIAACSKSYYRTIDSMLNVVNKEVLRQAATPDKAALRNEQRDWLTTRNEKFKEIDAAAKQDRKDGEESGTAIEDKATYLRERLDDLIGKLK